MVFVEQQTAVRWYRGCGKSTYELKPSLYRHPTLSTAAELYNQEYQILKRFRQRSIPYLDAPLETDDLSALFLMQHFGVPTRLLDWSENPYIALYFALTSAPYTIAGATISYANDAAVWLLDPVTWNGKALDFDPSPGIISPPDAELLNGYMPSNITTHRKPQAVALFGSHNSPRIVAQRGTFTLFGTSVKSLETAYIEADYPQDSLIKLIIKANNVSTMLASLLKIGFTDSVVYPDLTGLSVEIKRQFGYWV